MAETHVNQTGNGGNGRAGLYALMAIIIALIIVAIVLFLPRGDDGTRNIEADIRIEAPQVPTGGGQGDTDGGTTDGGAGDGG
jgi:hypothetical protein